MTDLTEQWKKGELPSGTYWLKTACTRFPEVGYYVGIDGKIDFYKKSDGFRTKNVLAVEKVLSKVPSYDEWKAKLEENAQLKELLKECQNMIAFKHEVYEEDALIKEINEVLK